MGDRSGAPTWRGDVLCVLRRASGQGTGSAPHQPPARLKLCRHPGEEWETGTALEAGETNCETKKHRQQQTFARNTFIQLLGDSSKAHGRNKGVRSSSPGAVIRRSVHLQTTCKA